MTTPLEDCRPSPRLRLSALWVSLMFCYVYGDYLGLYVPGKLAAVAEGRMAFGQLTPASHMAVALMMALPGLMVALTLLLPAWLARWSCVGLGLVYGGIMALTMMGGAPGFYLLLGTIEIALSAAIVWQALAWPRQP
ncbi:hypothetical protein B2G71_13690 [Novosphingobium sp. PC22D]|uniref:DUF6326 family protein n=1 Tax=Novosphingobium sp. PC22D TaxID=1962403 RepID=UPI000BF03E89|nr:DUF6326 family protein [Novosphingobium sp. PC22D]PEQ12240.1 hypothetical protein B2G71_13690 [Novosphingobium sp. PC22D]